MPQRKIPRYGSECDGLAEARVTRGPAGLPYSVFCIPYVGLGPEPIWCTTHTVQQASPYPKNGERGSFISGTSYN